MTAPDFAKEARDLAANPYSADEQRVADYLAEVAFGGGDDPIGYIITAHRWMRLVSIPNAKEAGEAAGRLAGRAEAAEIAPIARAICKSGRFETGQGTCAVICMEALGDARRNCAHVERVCGGLARKIADAILSASTTPDPHRDPGGAHGG